MNKQYHKLSLIALTALSTCIASVAQAESGTYKIDPVHSGISFKVRHFFNKVPGSFSKYTGSIHYDEKDISKSKAEATISISSVDTDNTKRDKHLQNDDFFNSPEHPDIKFTSSSWKKVSEGKFKITGDLTFAGMTKTVTLDAELLGIGPGQGHYEGIMMMGWSATTTIDRREWGMDYGAPAVGYEVEIALDIQAHKK